MQEMRASHVAWLSRAERPSHNAEMLGSGKPSYDQGHPPSIWVFHVLLNFLVSPFFLSYGTGTIWKFG
jgi:hypothetical protein